MRRWLFQMAHSLKPPDVSFSGLRLVCVGFSQGSRACVRQRARVLLVHLESALSVLGVCVCACNYHSVWLFFSTSVVPSTLLRSVHDVGGQGRNGCPASQSHRVLLWQEEWGQGRASVCELHTDPLCCLLNSPAACSLRLCSSHNRCVWHGRV